MRNVWLTAIVLLVGCTPSPAPTTSVGPPTNVRPSSATGTAVPSTQSSAPQPSSTVQPTLSPTQGAVSSPPSDGLGALFATLAPALAPFSPETAVITPAEQVVAGLQEALELVPEPAKEGIQAEIDRYTENELLERGSVTLGTDPSATLIVDRFGSQAGAAADFPERRTEGSCDEVAVPGDALTDVVVKRCNAPGANSLYLIANRSDLVTTLQVTDLPEELPIEPVVSMLADIFRAIEPSLVS